MRHTDEIQKRGRTGFNRWRAERQSYINVSEMTRILEIAATTLILLLIAPLIVLEWLCRRFSRLLRGLSIRELRKFLMQVMRSEETLLRLWTVFASDPRRVPAE